MIRWTDLIGLAGFAVVVLSLQSLFPDSAEHLTWMHWLGSLALWFVGFAAVAGWLLLRWSIRSSKNDAAPLLEWSIPQAKKDPEPKPNHLRDKKIASRDISAPGSRRQKHLTAKDAKNCQRRVKRVLSFDSL